MRKKIALNNVIFRAEQARSFLLPLYYGRLAVDMAEVILLAQQLLKRRGQQLVKKLAQ